MIDSVTRAADTPDEVLPYEELGLTKEEYEQIRGILGRRPTSSELAMYSVMWSEHCSYKSSKIHLRQFAQKAPKNSRMLVGMGENAGVVEVGDGLAVTFKIESHNHPSYVEPYQGAATGVGGIVRDILTMGARPIATLDPLRFGPADAPDTGRVLPGVVAGVGGYGNCLGLPTIGGELVFDPCYAGNPLVNVLCVGVLPTDGVKYAKATGVGNIVLLFGARTGGDGIGGASVLASATFEDAEKPAKRPSVQVGDPFTEKLLIECCLEIFKEDLVVGIQDLGAAGISCATTELASAGTGGMRVDLDTVPLRDETLRPEEILMSESQERMCAVVEPAKLQRFLEICTKWGVTATAIGEVTDTGRLEISWRGESIVDVPPRTVAHDGPVYDRPIRRPSDVDALQSDSPDRLPRSQDLRETLLRMVSTPNLADKRWVTDQYDRYVQGNTVLAQPQDSGMIRLNDRLGVAVAADGNGRYCRLDPYVGTQLALAEAYRNVAATGATPIAVTNCLNFGSPEDPEVMWQFEQSVTALADGCKDLGTPVTGGNVSFYNQTGTTPINPTPVIGVLGIIDDVNDRLPVGFADGARILLLGDTRDEFGGSEWAWTIHGHLGGRPPAVDLAREQLLAELLVEGAKQRSIRAAHDLSDGGLAQALVESCLAGNVGAEIALTGDPFVALFSESAGRAIVAVTDDRFEQLCAERGLPVTELGRATGTALQIDGVLTVDLAELRSTHEETLPKLFN
jgi:phosphoribosylformylglycinamidine synthase subunit PurL